jgi:hypothetical protein
VGGWESQGWHRKETAILRTAGVFRRSHRGTEKGINAEGGMQVIRNWEKSVECSEGVWDELGWKIYGGRSGKLGVKKGKGCKLLLNVPSWYCDEELGGLRVDSVGCKSCRCGRSPLVSKMCAFGPLDYLFKEDDKTLTFIVRHLNSVFVLRVWIFFVTAL